MIKTISLYSALLLASGWSALGQTQSNCPEVVLYEATPHVYQEKVQILKLPTVQRIAEGANKIPSPQGTRWFVQVDPDYKIAGPWSTTLRVGDGSHNTVQLEGHFLDHANTFYARWINDELLFVQVWWGRIVSSDLIIDVSTGKLVYDRFAHYGQVACQ